MDTEVFRRLCAPILKVFLKSTGLLLEPERYDYPGNMCAKIAENWEKLPKVLPSMEEVVQSMMKALTSCVSLSVRLLFLRV